MGKYEMLYLFESGQLEEHNFVWFSKVKSSVCLLKMTSKTDENVNWVKELALTNRRITICKVATNFIGSFQSILKDSLNMHQNSAKFMPCVLSEERKKNHVTCEFSGYKQNVTPHPPYSPDLVPWDLLLYPKLKMGEGILMISPRFKQNCLATVAKLQAVNFKLPGCAVWLVGSLYKDIFEWKAWISK